MMPGKPIITVVWAGAAALEQGLRPTLALAEGRWAGGDRVVAVVGAMLAEERPRLALLGAAEAPELLRALGAYSRARAGALAHALRRRWPSNPDAGSNPGEVGVLHVSAGGMAGTGGDEDNGEGEEVGEMEAGARGGAAAVASVYCRLALHLQMAAELVAAAAAAAVEPEPPLARRLHTPLASAQPGLEIISCCTAVM